MSMALLVPFWWCRPYTHHCTPLEGYSQPWGGAPLKIFGTPSRSPSAATPDTRRPPSRTEEGATRGRAGRAQLPLPRRHGPGLLPVPGDHVVDLLPRLAQLPPDRGLGPVATVAGLGDCGVTLAGEGALGRVDEAGAAPRPLDGRQAGELLKLPDQAGQFECHRDRSS